MSQYYNYDNDSWSEFDPSTATSSECMPFIPVQENYRLRFHARISLGQSVLHSFMDTLLDFTHQAPTNTNP